MAMSLFFALKAGPAHLLLVGSVSRPAGWQLDFAS